MPENANVDSMLTLLETATAETDSLINEGVDWNKVYDSFFNLTADLASVPMSAAAIPKYQLDELTDYVRKVRKIKVDNMWIVTYPNIHNFQNTCSLNVTYLYDYVIKEIRDHMAHPEKEFNQDRVNKQAIAKALKQCTGKNPSDTLDLNGFKYHYQMAVYGSFRKVTMIPKVPELTSCALKVPIILKFIDTKLIYRHISMLNKYQSDLIDEFKDLEKKNPEFKKYLTRYTNCVTTAISNTNSIYRIMRNTYLNLDIEYKRIFRYMIAQDELNRQSMQESAMLETAQFISSNLKPLKELSSKIGVLTESADPSILEKESCETVSESLKQFVANFKKQVEDNAYNRRNTRDGYKCIMGSKLLRLGANPELDPSFKVAAYESINRVINIDSLKDQFSKNIHFLNDILEHCDKYRNYDIKSIKQFIPPSLQECMPESDINLIGVLLTNISSKICGEYRYINPDINVVSQNIISIPDFLGVIDSHIIEVCDLVCSKAESISSSESNLETQKMVIDNITKVLFAYLAMILSIYEDLSIIEESALAVVDQIYDASSAAL